MATKGHDGSARTEQFDCDLVYHGFDGEDTPPNVYVEVSADYNNHLLAVVAAGSAGRYSFDLRIDGVDSIDIEEAYDAGTRCAVGELPAWIDAVVDDIKRELEIAA